MAEKLNKDAVYKAAKPEEKGYFINDGGGLYPQLSLQFMTVYASKGKEADYVVVFGLEKGEHSFPSEKATHPLLELLLPQAEAFAHAEECRLFYVALTRARHHVYLVTNGLNRLLKNKILLHFGAIIRNLWKIQERKSLKLHNADCVHIGKMGVFR